MKILRHSLIIVLCFFGTPLVTNAQNQKQILNIPEALLAKTILWQLHWDSATAVSNTIPSKVSFKMNNEAEVLVTELDWVISFVNDGDQVYPNHLQRLSGLPTEVRQRALSHFTNLRETTIQLPIYTNSFQKISALDTAKQQKIISAFQAEACRPEILALCKSDAGSSIKKKHFCIAPLDVNFPIVLYYVEGVPYIGKVYFNTQSVKPIYIDFDYSGDEGSDSRDCDRKLMRGIKGEGDKFELQGNHLLLVK